MKQEQLGAPDERATDEMLRFVRVARRAAPLLRRPAPLEHPRALSRRSGRSTPFAPHSTDPLGNAAAFHNHYRNSVALQERTVAAFLRELRALPGWDATAVLFLSDHGEQFREHGGLYHNHSLFDEELRVPGWIVAGPAALTGDQRTALLTHAGRRTYMQDVHETVVDLLGVEDARATLPFAALVTGQIAAAQPAARRWTDRAPGNGDQRLGAGRRALRRHAGRARARRRAGRVGVLRYGARSPRTLSPARAGVRRPARGGLAHVRRREP